MTRKEGARTDVLAMHDVTISRIGSEGGFHPLVTDVNLHVAVGEVLAIVGESGSGKSVTAMACIGLLPDRLFVSSGEIEVCGNSIRALDADGFRRIRGTRMSMIFQDPLTSLDPCFTIGSQMVESIQAHEGTSNGEARRRSIEMLDMVQIASAASCMSAFPHELSGGMRQRVMIAAALVLRPELLIADEPTTALDVTTQASILALVKDLQRELGMGVLWISHDLGVVADLADRVAVMYAGELVESATKPVVFADSRHPYTRGLIASSVIGRRGEPFASMSGSIPEPADWSGGCRFQPRCPRAVAACAEHPAFVQSSPEHGWRCVNPVQEGAAS